MYLQTNSEEFLVFWEVFRIFWGGGVPGFLGGVPGFLGGVPGCSGVPCSGVSGNTTSRFFY